MYLQTFEMNVTEFFHKSLFRTSNGLAVFVKHSLHESNTHILKITIITREITFIAVKVRSPLGWTWSNGWLELLIYLCRAALEKQIQHIYT